MAYYSKAWILFLEEIEKAKVELGFRENEECFYRGHTQQHHQLIPGLFRNQLSNTRRWQAEYAMFYEFRARAKELHQGNITDWDILFYMQHHGCRTRLLDWTENFAVALYFALCGKEESGFSPTIFMMNPYRLNEHFINQRDLYSPEFLDYWDEEEEEEFTYNDILRSDYQFWWDAPVALYPIRRVDRITTQGGYFTIHGNDERPIDTIVAGGAGIWKKLSLAEAAMPDAERFLEQAGIHEFTMFPDLDGLAKYLNRKYMRKSNQNI